MDEMDERWSQPPLCHGIIPKTLWRVFGHRLKLQRAGVHFNEYQDLFLKQTVDMDSTVLQVCKENHQQLEKKIGNDGLNDLMK